MSDLIDRQTAIEALHNKCVADGLLDEFDIEDVLRKLPSAEERTAKVRNIDGINYHCESCDTPVSDWWTYCAGCGAKLDWG